LTKLALEHTFLFDELIDMLLGEVLAESVIFLSSNYSDPFLCLLALDSLVLDELAFGTDDENFIKTIRTLKSMRTVNKVYDHWTFLRLFFRSGMKLWQLIGGFDAI